MCGIAGIFSPGDEREGLDARVAAMVRCLHHRGPDDAGHRRLGAACLGSTRLSLLDFAHGEQPLGGGDRPLLAYNGEIYNHATLRRELEAEGVALRGHCDTEVLWQLVARRGEAAFDALDGMWALAWSDGESLLLARDPFGIKPLLYALVDDGRRLVFASELKALLVDPGVGRRLDRATLCDRAVFGWTLGDKTIFEGVRTLPPGSLLRAHPGPDGRLRIELERHAPRSEDLLGTADPDLDLESAAARLLDALRASVRLQRLADHPVGAFLSGGVDSSLLAALMVEARAESAHGDTPIHTFSTAHEPDHPDLAMARRVAAALGTEHHEMVPRPRDLLAAVPDTVVALERPELPSIAEMMAPAIRRQVKAVLCGDGADELFGGYIVHAHPASWLQNFAGRYNLLIRTERALVDDTQDSIALLQRFGAAAREGEDSLRQAMYLHCLAEQLSAGHLERWDLGTMAHGLELRVPYLTPSLRRLALGLPWSLRIGDPIGRRAADGRLETKRTLRRAALDALPPAVASAVVERRKLAAPHAYSHPYRVLERYLARLAPRRSDPEHPLRPYVDAPHERVLLDLFVFAFVAHDGRLPDDFRLEDLYGRHGDELTDALQVATET
ncbi:MAG: asparagine synthase (glutamine-hydrolyzing) [Acidobacteriota bacterium]